MSTQTITEGNSNVCEHGYRFENGLCPHPECLASGEGAATDQPSEVDASPQATICQCEHEAHFGVDDHAAIHGYLKAHAGAQQAMHVGSICDACATEHLHEYLIQGPAGTIADQQPAELGDGQRVFLALQTGLDAYHGRRPVAAHDRSTEAAPALHGCGCGKTFVKRFGLRVHQRTCPVYQRTCTTQDAGRAALALVLPVGGLGTLLIALAAASGKLRYLVDHLPLPHQINGPSLLVIAGLLFAVCRRLARVESTGELVDRLVDLDTFEGGPWLGTRPATVERGPIRDLFLDENAWALAHYPEDVEQW